jgi:hypothetical protein
VIQVPAASGSSKSSSRTTSSTSYTSWSSRSSSAPGGKLFAEQSEKSDWKLKEVRPVGPDGVIVQTYERSG